MHEALATSSSTNALSSVSNHLFPKRMENREENSPSAKLGNSQNPKAQGMGVTAICAKSREAAENGLGWCTVLVKSANTTKGQTSNH